MVVRKNVLGEPKVVRTPTALRLPYIQTPTRETRRCFLFDDTDFLKADGDLSKLPSLITERENAETKGDAQSLIETGTSKSKAYRQKPASETKTDRDTRILELHGKGLNLSEIESRSTPSRL